MDRIGSVVRHAAQAGDHTAAGGIRLMLFSIGLNILLLRQLKRQRRDAASSVITALLRALAHYRPASLRGIAVVRADPGNGCLLEVLACHDGIGRTATVCITVMEAGVEYPACRSGHGVRYSHLSVACSHAVPGMMVGSGVAS
ncbi:hypothetical protein [Komagataeibacter medellinensis]|uniref:hypothetical protein n=1 Tax=Komagataeibacter medellinensis TaxID=1177712 RepID=UPI00039BA89C|nr:hypothetical protein [Komagataeibacter medellinensis]